MNIFNSIFDITKIPTKFFLVISSVSGFFIFSNEEILKRFKLDKFYEYNQYIGLIFLFSTSLVFINFIIWFFQQIKLKITTNTIKKNFKRRLKALDVYEKSVLRGLSYNKKIH